MISCAESFGLIKRSYLNALNAPKPKLITASVSYPNMNDEIQIERVIPCAGQKIIVKGGFVCLRAKPRRTFEEHIKKGAGENACWMWGGDLNSKGYGSFEVERRAIGAHRLSYQLHFGPIAEEICVLHNCPDGDNPACVNPDHLWLGTKGENNRDRESKGRGRQPKGDSNGTRTHPEKLLRGENNKSAKLDATRVTEIRALYGTESWTLVKLARKFGVSHPTISSIVHRYTWSHL